MRVTLRPGSTVASQQTTRQAWANEPANTHFTHTILSEVQHKSLKYSGKEVSGALIPGREDGYYSHTEEEPNLFIPVEFDIDHLCWVEIQWITEPETSMVADHWQVFQTAREELGLDITIEERDQHIVNEPSTPGSFGHHSIRRLPLQSPITIQSVPTSSDQVVINLFPDLVSPQTQEIIH